MYTRIWFVENGKELNINTDRAFAFTKGVANIYDSDTGLYREIKISMIAVIEPVK